MASNMYKHSKKINRITDHEHCPASIKSTIPWFPFHANTEHTGNIMQDDTHLISSLSKMFSMSEIHLSYGKKIWTICVYSVLIIKKTGLNSETNLSRFMIKPSLNMC